MTLYELHRYVEEAVSEFGTEAEVYFDTEYNEIMINLGGGVHTTLTEIPVDDK